MLQSERIISRSDRSYLRTPTPPVPRATKQRRAMVGALVLLLMALGTILYVDRDFWFPPDQDEVAQTSDASPGTPSQGAAATAHHKKTAHAHASRKVETASEAPTPDTQGAPPPVAMTARTAIPPLEVQVVAAGSRRTLHPGSNSVLINLEHGEAPAAPPSTAAAAPAAGGQNETAASVTSNAAERVQVSAETASIVTHSVTPGYPLLARQMKVQGSVVLQALIGRDGLIEDLHVLSGPPVLAGAAQEAVRQWHFKPHYQGVNAVETQTKITVNFTISTN